MRLAILRLATEYAFALGGPVALLDSQFVLPEVQIPLPELPNITIAISLPRPAPTPVLPSTMLFCGGVILLPQTEFPADGLIDLFGSVQDFRAALASETIEIAELKPAEDPSFTPLEYADHVVILPTEDAAALRAVLTYDAAYDWSAEPPVPSRHGFRVKFRSETRVLMLDLFLPTRCARVVAQGRVTPSVSFECGYSTIASIIKRYFPGAD